MAFLVSPGVQINEIDNTNVIPPVATTTAGFEGVFRWGPVDELTTVTSEAELAQLYGTPNADTTVDFHTAASFLKYSSNLLVNRIVGSGALNAASGRAALAQQINNLTAYENATTPAAFYAKYPGVIGNSLSVYVFFRDFDDAADSQYETYSSQFDRFDSQALDSDECHVLVVDTDGDITGTAGTVLEKFEGLSLTSGAKNSDGSSNYIKDVLASGSQYVWVGTVAQIADEDSEDSDGGTTSINMGLFNLYGGADGSAPTKTFSLFDDDLVDVSILIGGYTTTSLANSLVSLAEGRKDVMVCLSPERSDTVGAASVSAAVAAVKGWADSITSSSYAALDSTAGYVYDKYKDSYIWIPLSGHVAGLMAKIENDRDAWFSPSGYNNGRLLGVVKLALNPAQAQRDTLYKARVNPVVSFPGQGIVLFGDKTALAKPSAFDRINVRRLFIVLQKAIAQAAKYQLFELNDEFTRATFRNMVEPFLRDVRGRRGIYDFYVKCDAENNNGEVVDSNRFVGDIYIKPARSINYIQLNFIATRTGVEFSEVAGAQG